jgi:hypothetical protein
MYATMDGSVSHQPGDVAGVTFTAPTGTAISGFRVSRSILVGPGGSPAQAQADLIYSGLLAEPSCTSATCKSRGDGNATFSPANLVEKQGLTNVSTLTWQVGCYGNLPCPTVTSPMIYSAAYFVSMADILLDDPSAPATATASGALATGGRLSGPQSATFTGTDTGSGVFKGLLVIDGATVAQQSAAAAGSLCTDLAVAPDARPSFLTAVPCPPQGQGTLTFDTSTLARGTHTAQVIVSDAAGNRRVASTSTTTIKGGGHG